MQALPKSGANCEKLLVGSVELFAGPLCLAVQLQRELVEVVELLHAPGMAEGKGLRV